MHGFGPAAAWSQPTTARKRARDQTHHQRNVHSFDCRDTISNTPFLAKTHPGARANWQQHEDDVSAQHNQLASIKDGDKKALLMKALDLYQPRHLEERTLQNLSYFQSLTPDSDPASNRSGSVVAYPMKSQILPIALD
jgi:hypothetical protein